ncbi:sugar transferase [Blastopirellula sp. JC732]|uniref:Sugar transferase n=1 Tax=Blastopirellula sediminis TaxID=2894196 RepID=A0A9X1MI10_9BACT|nr:sugar transferase [Blastopirellula sediminis]MCC9608051.1 sugar transferase [Blastopirellula sediminis]MCC9627156.1 sugar transferase [Blastopirellula sediminis]
MSKMPFLQSRNGRDDKYRGLRSAEEIRFHLDCERTRSLRSGRPFAVIRFRLESNGSFKKNLAQVQRELDARLRIYDHVGLLEDRSLLILLPETDNASAATMATELRDRIGDPAWLGIAEIANAIDEGAESQEMPKDSQQVSMVSISARPLSRWKRIEDVCGALVLLALFSPIMIIAAIAVRLTSGSPVIFRQQRTGRGGKPFTMYKFRTMRNDAEARKAELMALNERDGPAFKLKRDPRVTPLGNFLRSSCIDEMPQLFNVLRGDMSLVGPRPLPCDEQAASAPWHQSRLDVTPGITCIWQAHPDRNVTFDEWMRMDIRYARQTSFFFDVRIMLATVGSILRTVIVDRLLRPARLAKSEPAAE